jgi:tetratricopeptide (TPR) repeat protein
LLLLPDEANYIRAIEHTLRADRYVKQKGELVKMLSELAQEQSTNRATSSAQRTAGHLLHYIEVGSQDPTVLVAIDYLLGKIAQEPSFSPELLATLYRRKGRIFQYRVELQKALSNYNRALGLVPKEARLYILRGNVYRRMGENQQAIKDFDSALELNPKNTEAYANRGLAFLGQGNL